MMRSPRAGRHRMRASGILLPVSSLPSRYGIGCFSRSAYRWIDFLKKSGQTFWQILPLSQTGYGDSPYQSVSTFAGNPYFISFDDLIDEGLLTREECDSAALGTNPSYVDYGKQYENRYPLLRKAFENSKKRGDEEFLAFEKEEEYWLLDFALYMAVKNAHGGKAWTEWEEDLVKRRPETIEKYKDELSEEILFYEYLQFWFLKQWKKVKAYANENGIKIIGDMPIYVAFDSADAWTHPDMFQFDEDMKPVAVAGCPPDGFTEDGQLWGNPLYRWDAHAKDGYKWWISRVAHSKLLYDVIRIDHFRGFETYYCIPYGMENAKTGTWEKGPGTNLFSAINTLVPDVEIIAEDLGFITPEVKAMVAECGYPGMKVLEFAFGGGYKNDYLPYNYQENSVVYTGTHDNETLMQYLEDIPEHTKKHITDYLGMPDASDADLCDGLIRLAMLSVSKYCIIPIQDYLHEGRYARINFPSSLGGNWEWRTTKECFTDELSEKILKLTQLSDRMPQE